MAASTVQELLQTQLLEMYRRMVRIRFFENTAWEGRTEIPGVIHTSVGMEASVVGPCMALRDDDYMVGTHRSHGHPIGKGARIDRLFAELMGKVTGINQGKGGSMHLSDFSVGQPGRDEHRRIGAPGGHGRRARGPRCRAWTGWPCAFSVTGRPTRARFTRV